MKNPLLNLTHEFGEVSVFKLEPEPKLAEQLIDLVIEINVQDSPAIILDFQDVTFLKKESISSLLRLKHVNEDRKLVFCNVDPRILHLFERIGIADKFEICKEKEEH